EKVEQAAAFLGQRIATPEVAVVLGSGLGQFSEAIVDRIVIPYADIPHWPSDPLIGHGRMLTAGTVAGRPVVVLEGRAHRYQGYTRSEIAFAPRVLARIGVPTLVLTNASGGINTAFTPGSVMVIDDHINLLGDNPLIGPHDDRFGPRFPDMTQVYASRLRAVVELVGAEVSLRLVHGVYVAVHGPSFETPAEIKFLRTIGADAVGMSTVPEAIVARQMGLEVLGLACITNMAAGVLPKPLHQDDVLQAAEQLAEPFGRLLTGLIRHL
ncbi:MAG: purine-nucleoside phosphorylase, partial [Acidobacteriota bacterium]|nr:purine-nucleoside phosphorylase [Acidobacteriota bacterium]